jgi:hypothetical protein
LEGLPYRLQLVASFPNGDVKRKKDSGLRTEAGLEGGNTPHSLTEASGADVRPIFGAEMNYLGLSATLSHAGVVPLG